ncbi:MAG: heme-binding domain-containing protein [Chloroflexi bacterium]|nr:heme-binding domain-containing protein [Chloroflexota bacterium]
MKKIGRPILIVVAALIVLFLVIQPLPIGKDHTNPPVVSEPNWDSPATRDLAQRACFDCHSNETVWPWYSTIAPFSWLIYSDVVEGRQKMNFSEWTQGGSQDIDELMEVLQEGEMPPFQYLLMHPEAKLTDDEKQTLIDGLRNTIP